MKLNISDLKNLITKLNLAVEKSKINPKAGWIELETDNESISFKVSNYDYYLESSILANEYIDDKDKFHVTILAETFIPLVSKLDVDEVNLYEKLNSLMLETEKSSYTFPVIKELGKTKCVDVIEFNATSETISIDGSDLESVANVNANGIADAIITKEIQQFVYVDEKGALTFTENIYVNDFKTSIETEFKFLLNVTQAKLLNIFKGEKDIQLEFEQEPTFNTCQTNTNKICLSNDRIKLVMVTQTQDMVDKFPSFKIRTLAENTENTHVVIDKKALDKALTRLMVFDKKFDITVMDYSKLVFKENELELISIKNKNFEKIPYVSSQNVVEHESIIRFADLIKQLKAVNSKEIDISYGSRSAIVINSNIKQVIPEIRLKDNRV